MNKKAVSLLGVITLCTAMVSLVSCGKGSHISKILREDATDYTMMWLELIKEYGVNYEYDGTTILGEAIKSGRVDMVEALIKDKVDVNRPAIYYNMFAKVGIPPLVLAGDNGIGTSRVMFGVQAEPEQLSEIRVMLIKAGAAVQIEQWDTLLQSVALGDEATFEAALPKYNKEMLDYSSYGEEEYKAGRNPFRFISKDENFENQKPMLQGLMKKGIGFGFYDTAKAIQMYLDPNLATYGDEFLYDILVYMTKQDSFNMLGELLDDENNPQYINPLDLTIGSIYIQTSGASGDNVFPTDPDLYLKVVTLFGDSGLHATPYEWRVPYEDKAGYPKSSTGTLPMFLRIIAAKIRQDIATRKAYDEFTSATYDRDLREQWYEEEKNTVVYEEWTPEVIINAFEVLSKYDALYHSLEDTDRYHLNDANPVDYLYRQILGTPSDDNLTLPYSDLFEPYYPVFEWLNKNGYLVFGTKDHLTYEDGLNVSEYFSTLDRRIIDRNSIPNSTDPNDRYVNIERIRGLAEIGRIRQDVLIEAEEIISGKRIGFSPAARNVLSREGLPWNVTTKNVDVHGRITDEAPEPLRPS